MLTSVNEGLRLKKLLEREWGLKSKLAEFLKVSPQAVSQMYEKEYFEDEKFKEILEFLGLWSREQFYAESDALVGLAKGSKTMLEDSQVEYLALKSLLYVPQAAEAGFLSGDVSPITNRDLLPYQGIPTFDEPGYAFVVSGESMLDTLRPGEVIITGRDPIRSIKDIKTDYIYVLDTEDAILVKRVNRHLDDDKLWLVSDNEDYDEIEISFEKIRNMWMARRIIGFNLTKKMRYE